MATCPCPCKNCITLGICRNKPYVYLIMDCSLINRYLYEDKGGRSRDFKRRTIRTIKMLNPTQWPWKNSFVRSQNENTM